MPELAQQSKTTQAAEGMLRRRFTVADVEAMTEAGILDESDRIELIGGEIVPMAAKGNHHEVLKMSLNLHWAGCLPKNLLFITETTLRLPPDSMFEPDFVFFDKATGLKSLRRDNIKLLVEIADTSYGYDIGRKAGLYASFGIVELWVIHAVRRETRIHREPSITGYQVAMDLTSDQVLIPACAPELAVTLDNLELYP